MKKKISPSSTNRLINHGPIILVSTLYKNKPNLFPVAWNMPVSHNPPLIAIAVGKSNYSFEAIHKTGLFVINIPDKSIVKKVFKAGTMSGRNCDKFEILQFTASNARIIKSVIVEECIAHIECEVIEEYVKGDHSIFIGKAASAYADKNLFNHGIYQTDSANTIHHLGGNNFCVSGETIKV